MISAAADNNNFRSERIQTPFSIVFATLANELKPVRDVACAVTTDQGKQNDLDELARVDVSVVYAKPVVRQNLATAVSVDRQAQ